MADIATALQKLATYRTHNNRASQETFEKGVVILRNNAAKNMGEEGWAFLEQLALAAIDVGRLDVAERCLGLLAERFPDSPRVGCLTGIYMEATQSPEVALGYYQDILNEDSANAALWKRKISVLRRMGKIDKAVEELSQFLDTFYTDVEGWLELADLYSTCNQYTYALQSLSHVLLLAPQNPFYVLQAAETAYTAADIPLSLKMFLTAVDMTDVDDSVALADSTPEGITVRAWYGVKLCTRRLLKEPRLSTSPSQTPAPKNLALIDELATERLSVAYSSSGRNNKIVQGRNELLTWVAAS
jgi:tetratricopeptide (TPR) repeat protein